MTPIGMPKETLLADLNKAVKQYENIIGPLTAVGNDGNQTLLTFNELGAKPAKNAVIVPTGTNPPTGATQEASGKIFIASTLTDVTTRR